MQELDLSWAKDSIFEKINTILGSTKSIEDVFSAHLQFGIKVIPKDPFADILEKFEANITKEDAIKLAEALLDKESERINIDQFYSCYYKFFPKAKGSYENFMEEIRKAVFEGLFDICEELKEFDSAKNGSLDLIGFQSGLKKIKAKLTDDQIKSLFEIIDKENTENISYKGFAAKLEEYSLTKSQVPPGHSTLDPIIKIRQYIKNNSTNTMQVKFKDIIKPNLDGNRWITKKDFRNALNSMDILLTTTLFEEFAAFLDPSHVDQIDFEFFCTSLGYIQPSLKSEPNSEIKAESKVDLDKSEDDPLVVKKMIEEIEKAAAKSNLSLNELLKDKDKDNTGKVTKLDFEDIIRTARGGLSYNNKELMMLCRHFQDSSGDDIQYYGFLSEIDHVKTKLKSSEPKEVNLKWADKILDEICIFLYCQHKEAYDYFKSYGLNPDNMCVPFKSFEQGIQDMKISINPADLDHLKHSLDIDDDQTISGKEFKINLDNRKDQALERYNNEVMSKVISFVKERSVNLVVLLKKYDRENNELISSFEFQSAIRDKFQALLTNQQYMFLIAKYESEKDKIKYMKFIEDVGEGQAREEEKEEIDVVRKLKYVIQNKDKLPTSYHQNKIP